MAAWHDRTRRDSLAILFNTHSQETSLGEVSSRHVPRSLGSYPIQRFGVVRTGIFYDSREGRAGDDRHEGSARGYLRVRADGP